MIKQSKYEQAVSIIAIVAFVAVVFVLLNGLPLGWEKPLMRVYTPSECAVEVTNYLPNRHCAFGSGVVINHGGETFILTSSMIFTHVGEYRVEVDKVSYDAELVHQNDVWGLVALKCSSLKAKTPSVKINEYPNHPPGTQVRVGTWGAINTLDYVNDDWVLLDGNLPVVATGMPVENDGGLVGIIVGLNRMNVKQTIMVGNRAIGDFIDQIPLLDAPPILHAPTAPFEDRHRMPLRPPANPNLLFGGE